MGEWIENSVNNLCPCRELFFSQLDSQSFMTKDSAPLKSNLVYVRMCFYLNSTRIILQANRQTDRHEDTTTTSNKKNKKKENKNKKNK